jgi:Carboxypeptidase regulatory-like domain
VITSEPARVSGRATACYTHGMWRSAVMVRRVLRACVSVVTALAMASLAPITAAHAQVIRVELLDSATSAPIAGALVSASTATRIGAIDALTNAAGVANLRVPMPGLWSVTVRRIGSRPRAVPDVRVDSGQIVRLDLRLSPMRQELPRVRVVADAGQCGRAPEGEARTAVLWEQITLALRASTLTREDSSNALKIQSTVYERELSSGLEELTAKVTKDQIGNGRPFLAADPSELADSGYVRADSGNFVRYFAPDEHVLLSEAFLRTHCFDSPKRDRNAALAELRFYPIRDRFVPDVSGTAFVDARSGELRHIEFRFVTAGRFIPVPAPNSGGIVRLERLRNQQWIVSEWSIRMPTIIRYGETDRYRLTGYREIGGVASVIGDTR